MMSGILQNKYDLRISAFPRIHITLIGMNKEGYRLNGGIGFSITDPKIEISFKLSDKGQIIDLREGGFSTSEKARLLSKIENIRISLGFKRSIDCYISGDSMTHYGFGTSTATYLSCIEALFILNDKKYDQSDICLISSRGGTSGIGINTYFKGGFVLDAGIPTHLNYQFGPSSLKGESDRLPLVLNHINTPNWPLGILISKQLKSLTELEEIQFFQETCPIDNVDVQSTLYEVIFGSLCSVMESNFSTFSTSINSIQKTRWKNAERSLYEGKIDKIEKQLFKLGAKGVGMSSLGPGIYIFSNDLLKIKKQIENDTTNLFLTKMNNNPRIIQYD